MFYFSRLAVELLSPLNTIFLLLIAGLLSLLFRRLKTAVGSLSCALLIFVFCGYGFIGKNEIRKQEALFQPLVGEYLAALPEKGIEYIVVLGSGHVSDSRLPATSQIGGSSLFRLTEGIRLLNFLPGTKLVLTGGIGHDPVPNADVVKRVAEGLGVFSDRIITETRPRDTVQEARFLEPLLSEKEFILVTSALHMTRALEIFKSFGMHPIAAPTDYVLKQHVEEPPGEIFPSIGNIDLARRIIYEWIGAIWSRAKIALQSFQ